MGKKILIMLSVVLLCACSSKVTKQNYQKIKTNMTLQQVTEILGSPSSQSPMPLGALKINAVSWSHQKDKIVVQFLDNKVAFKNYSRSSTR